MDALAQVQAAGLTALILGDGRLGITPAERITPELREVIKAHKAEILALLQTAEIAPEVERSAAPVAVELAQLATTSADTWPPLCFYHHIPRWQRSDGAWVCAECHPPANGELIVGRADNPPAAPVATDAPWCDPRPELAADSALWARLLALAYDADGGAIDGLFWTLQGLRCYGAGLGLVGGKLKLTAGAMDPDEYAADCPEYLMEHRAALWALLARLDATEGKATQ